MRFFLPENIYSEKNFTLVYGMYSYRNICQLFFAILEKKMKKISGESMNAKKILRSIERETIAAMIKTGCQLSRNGTYDSALSLVDPAFDHDESRRDDPESVSIMARRSVSTFRHRA